MTMRTYDPGLVAVILAGQQITGFADGTFIKVERLTDTFSSMAGADGQVARVRSRDKRGKVTITLLQTSPSNIVLAELVQLDEATGAGSSPFMVKDLTGTTQASAPNAWVTRPADIERGKDLYSPEWVLEVDDLETFTGGTLSL